MYLLSTMVIGEQLLFQALFISVINYCNKSFQFHYRMELYLPLRSHTSTICCYHTDPAGKGCA